MLTTLTCNILFVICDRIIARLGLTSKRRLFAQPYAILQNCFSNVNSLSPFLGRDLENQENVTKRHLKIMPSILFLWVSAIQWC